MFDPWLPPPHSVWGATQPLRIQTVSSFAKAALTSHFRARKPFPPGLAGWDLPNAT